MGDVVAEHRWVVEWQNTDGWWGGRTQIGGGVVEHRWVVWW
jgi:hypothetical protein